MPIENLVLITGAGASRELGSAEERMPPMDDWSRTLLKALEREGEMGLAELVGIKRDQSGEDFERAVGEFLAWERVLSLSAQFLPMGMDRNKRVDGDARDWSNLARLRADKVINILHKTLYEQFGQGRVNPELAKHAYAQLFHSLALASDATITVATTNYDPAAEIALAELDMRPEIGDQMGAGGHRVLRPEGLSDRTKYRQVPVLHLHGAVGWWTQDDGTVRMLPPNTRYSPDYEGRPTVLLPDPAKDPTLEPAVRVLWEQFDLALSQASHVLVVGHSLHDPVLVEHINSSGRPVAVGLYAPDETNGAVEQSERDRIHSLISNVTDFGIRFGPNFWINRAGLDRWNK